MSTAFVITGPGELSTVPAPDAEPLPAGHVRIAIAYCGICGSDVDAYRQGYPYHPTLSGHEWSGTVAAVGAGVDGLVVGDAVARTCQPPCGACELCRAGRPHNCVRRSLSTVQTAPAHGAYTRTIEVPARSVVALPAGVGLAQGALVEPATVALHGVRRTRPRLGDTAVVIGLGVIGLFATQLALLSGVTRVIAVEPLAQRREIAQRYGPAPDSVTAFAPDDPAALDTITAVTGGRGADMVYECSGQGAAAMNLASAALRPGGHLMMIGAVIAPVEVYPALWLAKELTVDTALAHTRDEFDVVVDLMDRGLLDTAAMTGDVRPLRDLPDVLDQLVAGPGPLKVLIDPTTD
ncbi:zinc-dependent alcohol dehydrogenase [Gordonia crocea]|uniref:Zn-dependent alcohol dehydrogenase n=1 Tax=Gordonia crocea TaxID=589162 RepID=A0A7M3SUC0_9ACTN|nr:alcohol dehydrogenase catalytic domain-containing protein [Gordonia crocea]GED96244.1 Zn-dependent alcohol dehydrogenase [Gordonia crocea]